MLKVDANEWLMSYTSATLASKLGQTTRINLLFEFIKKILEINMNNDDYFDTVASTSVVHVLISILENM